MSARSKTEHPEQLWFRFGTPLPGYDFAICTSGKLLLQAQFMQMRGQSNSAPTAKNDTQAWLQDKICNFLQTGSRLPKVQMQAAPTAFGASFREALVKLTPPGKVASYGDLSRYIKNGSTSASQAIGQACGSNPLALFVPCHRVIAHNGLGGYMQKLNGQPNTELKIRLLKLEGVDTSAWQA